MNMNLIIIGIGGFFGAILRYLISSYITKFNFPLGTLIVNILGSFILGFIMYFSLYSTINPEYRLFIATGFCGALTTFSTFSYETFLMIEEGLYIKALLNILLNIILCLISIYLGRVLALFLVRV
ncbi:CrcB protein [Methanocaldococcus infernus ME]|uniref:Fluoride-specific ion channel FluC n=1 Tax=Methanocaldococcus infernus (strain DSM 11812 / JCM 15783 / ME) TaxID=573063 RepID=D5VTH0_METIM|nr:fluoride efflux transporter CrcB [Methanocaldococcus infernus]ADG13873.1 CrcB protein [Methanocaldococcus infernus ME]